MGAITFPGLNRPSPIAGAGNFWDQRNARHMVNIRKQEEQRKQQAYEEALRQQQQQQQQGDFLTQLLGQAANYPQQGQEGPRQPLGRGDVWSMIMGDTKLNPTTKAQGAQLVDMLLPGQKPVNKQQATGAPGWVFDPSTGEYVQTATIPTQASGEPPKPVTFQQGREKVTQRYNPQTGQWVELARGPMDAPKDVGNSELKYWTAEGQPRSLKIKDTPEEYNQMVAKILSNGGTLESPSDMYGATPFKSSVEFREAEFRIAEAGSQKSAQADMAFFNSASDKPYVYAWTGDKWFDGPSQGIKVPLPEGWTAADFTQLCTQHKTTVQEAANFLFTNKDVTMEDLLYTAGLHNLTLKQVMDELSIEE